MTQHESHPHQPQPPEVSRPAPVDAQLVPGPARLLVLAGGGLGIVIYLLGFFDDLALSTLVLGPLLVGGGLLAAAAVLPRIGRVLVPAAVAVSTGTLLLLQLVAAGNAPTLAIVALVVAFLQTAAVVGAVLLDAGIVTAPVRRPTQASSYGGPGYGGYPPGYIPSAGYGQPGQPGQPGYGGQPSQGGQPAYGPSYGQPGYGPQPGDYGQPASYGQVPYGSQPAPYGSAQQSTPAWGQAVTPPSATPPSVTPPSMTPPSAGPAPATDQASPATLSWYGAPSGDTPPGPGVPMATPPAVAQPEASASAGSATGGSSPADPTAEYRPADLLDPSPSGEGRHGQHDQAPGEYRP